MVAAGWLLADLTYRRGILSAERMSEFAYAALLSPLAQQILR